MRSPMFGMEWACRAASSSAKRAVSCSSLEILSESLFLECIEITREMMGRTIADRMTATTNSKRTRIRNSFMRGEESKSRYKQAMGRIVSLFVN